MAADAEEGGGPERIWATDGHRSITLEQIDYAGNLNELDYWDQMYKAGAQSYFDILSANAYGLDLPPADPLEHRVVRAQHPELHRSQLHRLAGTTDHARRRVQFHVAHAQDLRFGILRPYSLSAAQDRANAGNQKALGKGLRDIIVGAHRQPDQATGRET